MPYTLGTGYYFIAPPSTVNLQQWGAPSQILFPAIASIGAGVALTTSQEYLVSPFPYCYLYDVIMTITASGTGGTHQVDIYNAVSGGVSYLNAAFAIPSSVAALTFYSARFGSSYLLKSGRDPYLNSQAAMEWQNSGAILPMGAVFSIRAATPATTGSLSNLQVYMVLVPSDRRQFIYQ